MVAKQYADAPTTALGTLISPSRFRTVMPTVSRNSGGSDEIRVQIQLGKDFIETLDENPTLDGITVYGFVRENETLRSEFGGDLETDRKGCAITLWDWGDRFLLVCSGLNDRERAFFIIPDEVRHLLQNCLRAPITR